MTKYMTLAVDKEDVLEYLYFCFNHQELIDFILELDGMVAEWGFTKELYQSLTKVMEEYEE